jgi:hypothetical protein
VEHVLDEDNGAPSTPPVVGGEVREAYRAAVRLGSCTPHTCITVIFSASVKLATMRAAFSGVMIALSSMSRAMSLTHCAAVNERGEALGTREDHGR